MEEILHHLLYMKSYGTLYSQYQLVSRISEPSTVSLLFFWEVNNPIPSLKLTDRPLKMEGWKTIFLLGKAYFQVGTVSFGGCICFSFGFSIPWGSTVPGQRCGWKKRPRRRWPGGCGRGG